MDFPVGSLGYDAGGRHIRSLDAYAQARQKARVAAEIGQLDAQEAMSTSDFATYIGSFLRHSFLDRYTEVSGQWAQYTRPMSLRDFETYTTSGFGRFPDIPQRSLNAEYEQMALREISGPSVRLIEWGAAWSVTRQLILSDRDDRLRDLPTMAAEALARTVSKRAVSVLEANPNTYDGNALFSSAHVNIGSTALTADVAGMNAIKAAIDALDTQTDPEGYKIVQPGATYTLIVPRGYRWIAEALRDRETLPYDVTSSTSVLRANEVAGRFSIIEELYLTDTNNWYMATGPTGRMGFIGALSLNGNTQPYVGLKDPISRGVFGGDDPYSFDFDEIDYKVRHDFDFVPLEWRGVYGAIVA